MEWVSEYNSIGSHNDDWDTRRYSSLGSYIFVFKTFYNNDNLWSWILADATEQERFLEKGVWDNKSELGTQVFWSPLTLMVHLFDLSPIV